MNQTGRVWARELAPDVILLDQAGWDSQGEFERRKISKEEFEHRVAQSRIIAPRGLYFLWKDKTKNG
jgi:hypothetical protein